MPRENGLARYRVADFLLQRSPDSWETVQPTAHFVISFREKTVEIFGRERNEHFDVQEGTFQFEVVMGMSARFASVVICGGLIMAGAGGWAKATTEKSSEIKSEEKELAARARQVEQIKVQARKRISDYFKRQRVTYPPNKVTVVALKQERVIKVFAPDRTGQWRFLMQYPVAAASGILGPKLCEGDEQVPEGIYRVTHLNSQSLFHLSLGLDYPNQFDKEQAVAENRKAPLGNEIFIHGSWFSIGCLALGNTAIEDIYTLAADTGVKNLKVIISPLDFREQKMESSALAAGPKWLPKLYANLERELRVLGDAGTASQSQLVRYADSIPPPPPEAEAAMTDIFGALAFVVSQMADAATSETAVKPAQATK